MISELARLDLNVHDPGAAGARVITLRGDLDLASAGSLREALFERLSEGPVVLELSGLGFCDSAGLRTLVEAERASRTHGHQLRLCALSPAVDRVLTLAGAHAVFSIFPDAQAALGQSALSG